MKNLYLTLMNAKTRSDEHSEKYRQSMGTDAWLRECGTITLDFGRCTGKTSAALDFMRMHPKAALVVCNFAFMRHLKKANPDLEDRIFDSRAMSRILVNHRQLPENLVYTPDSERGQQAHDITFSHIILDEPRFIPESFYGVKFMDLLYHSAYRIGVRRIIRIGMI